MPFIVTTFSVKKQIWKIRRFSRFANIKIIFPLNMAKANAAAIQNTIPASFSAAVPQWAAAGRRAAASAPWCMPA
ncbi:MAG: hypothetical protein EGR99_04170 [Faecalibacterium sp.]|nr:hypothetical protein [Faecalibacterium sp.]